MQKISFAHKMWPQTQIFLYVQQSNPTFILLLTGGWDVSLPHHYIILNCALAKLDNNILSDISAVTLQYFHQHKCKQRFSFMHKKFCKRNIKQLHLQYAGWKAQRMAVWIWRYKIIRRKILKLWGAYQLVTRIYTIACIRENRIKIYWFLGRPASAELGEWVLLWLW